MLNQRDIPAPSQARQYRLSHPHTPRTITPQAPQGTKNRYTQIALLQRQRDRGVNAIAAAVK